jgi:DNA modification methylase
MTVALIRGDARQLALADASVDLIVTSPPYFALRSYTDGGEHYSGQVGSEATPAEFVAALVECTREWMRVLKPAGSIWVNLGDSYYSGKGAPGRTTVDDKSEARTVRRAGGNPLDGPSFGISRKSLIGLPWRYALACIDELGLILRAEVIWDKPNGLPESVTDRVRRSHEQWFHMVKQPRYFAAVDEIREQYSPLTHGQGTKGATAYGAGRHGISNSSLRVNGGINPLGKLPGSVWSVASQPLTVPKELGIDHFAAFPMEWPRRLILGWSPSGVCVECGEGRRPVTTPTGVRDRTPGGQDRFDKSTYTGLSTAALTVREITGYACACAEPTAPTRPSVVLDPFGGTGTTALVASVLGRRGISVDMSADYCRLAQWRTGDAKQRERALRPAKPAAPKPPRSAAEWLAHFGI